MLGEGLPAFRAAFDVEISALAPGDFLQHGRREIVIRIGVAEDEGAERIFGDGRRELLDRCGGEKGVAESGGPDGSSGCALFGRGQRPDPDPELFPDGAGQDECRQLRRRMAFRVVRPELLEVHPLPPVIIFCPVAFGLSFPGQDAEIEFERSLLVQFPDRDVENPAAVIRRPFDRFIGGAGRGAAGGAAFRREAGIFTLRNDPFYRKAFARDLCSVARTAPGPEKSSRTIPSMRPPRPAL